jgi:hypothetical protein
MFISESAILMRQKYDQELRREAERERLIQAAGLRPSQGWGLSLPLPELKRGRLNLGAALKSLLRPAGRAGQFSQVK